MFIVVGFEFLVQGSWFMVESLVSLFSVFCFQGLGFRVFWFRAQGSEFSGLGFRVSGLGSRV